MGGNKTKPHVLAILPGIIPSTSILIIKPLLQLNFSGCIELKIVLESTVGKKQIEWADLVSFCRNTEPRFRKNLDQITRLGIPYIYDLDDNFFELPENTELGAYHRRPERIALLREYLEKADLVRVYSPTMLEYIRPMSGNLIEAFAPIDFRQVDTAEKRAGGRVKIVFSTSSYQNNLLSIALPAVDKILRNYSDKTEAHFWGVKPEGITNRPNAYFHRFIMNYDRFLRRFSQAHFDIGLAPIQEDIFHRSKTNNKFREYGACGVAGIYSDVDVYSNCVQHESTGLLVANSTASWYDSIARLIEDPDLMQKLQKQSRDYVRRHYSQEQFESFSWEVIQRLVRKKRAVKAGESKTTLTPSIEIALDGKLSLVERIRMWRIQMKTLDKNPFSFFLGLAGRSLFLRWSLLKYRIVTSVDFKTRKRRADSPE